MVIVFVLCMILLQSCQSALIILQCRGDAVGEIYMNHGLSQLNVIDMRVEYGVNCGVDYAAICEVDFINGSAITLKHTRLMECSNGTAEYSLWHTSLDAKFKVAVQLSEFVVVYIHEYSYFMYDAARDLPEWRPGLIAQHLNGAAALYYLSHTRSCAAGAQRRYSGSCPGTQVHCSESYSMEMVFEIGIYCVTLAKHCPSQLVNLSRQCTALENKLNLVVYLPVVFVPLGTYVSVGALEWP